MTAEDRLVQGGSKTAALGIQATFAARNRTLAAHKEEFEGYLREERIARGLPPERQGAANHKLKLKVAELEAKLRKYEEPARGAIKPRPEGADD